MENTEKSSTESSSTPIVATAPASQVVVNKPNPNMVMALVLLFMLIVGLAVAFFYKGNGINGGSEDLSEKEKYQMLIDAERGGGIDGRASAAALEGRISSILENTHAIQSEYGMLKAGYSKAKDELNRLGNEVQGNLNTISRLGSDNAALKNQIVQLQSLARNAQTYQNQVQQLSNSNAEKATIISTLQGRPSNESMQQLKQDLSREQMTRSELSRKIQELEQRMLSMVDMGESNKNRDKVAELQAQNDELRRQLQALQTKVDFGKLFVKSHADLPANAQALYYELKGLEGASTERLRGAYALIAGEHNAENLQQVRFATGSSILNFTDQTKIKNKIDITNSGDYFLVVGYASKTGNAATNQKISANRATAVASIVNQLKKSGQEVKAVYLGQTDRFSKSVNAENQLCEIWRIRK